MKKIALLAVLILLVSIVFASTSICYADSISDLGYYYEVTDTNGLQTYIKDGDAYKQGITIPYSYFFKISTQATNGYYKISYNDCDLYISEATAPNSIAVSKKDNLNQFQQGPYVTMEIVAKDDTAITLYNFDFAEVDDSKCTAIKFIGYTQHENVYYFLCKVTLKLGGDYVYYLKASDNIKFSYLNAKDVSGSDFNPSIITINPDSKKATDDQNAKDIEVAQNKLRRNIFFFVICVVCVLIVLLIYNPFKKKQPQKTNPNMTSDDDF